MGYERLGSRPALPHSLRLGLGQVLELWRHWLLGSASRLLLGDTNVTPSLSDILMLTEVDR